jgi:hypothetical protein
MSEETAVEIHIRETLDEKWIPYFAPFYLAVVDDETVITGVVHDQAELFGLLLKIRDLGLTLLSFMPTQRVCC